MMFRRVIYALTEKGNGELGINSDVMIHTEETLAKEFQNRELKIDKAYSTSLYYVAYTICGYVLKRESRLGNRLSAKPASRANV